MLWIILLVLIIFADQLSKWLVVALLQGKESVYVIPGVLRFTYVENDGAAFGMLDDHRWVFLVLSTVMIIALIFYIVKYKPSSKWVMTSLILIVGGGIGNMIDRILLGYVIDFIDFCAFPQLWRWVFNIADSAVCVGTFMLSVWLIIDTVKEYKREKAEKEKAE
ncbi:MAG: signal peptidase II [Clostridia bacterium]|jgi:signal peptidase II|nr:signal peptidase II [Clostridia bacterium]